MDLVMARGSGGHWGGRRNKLLEVHRAGEALDRKVLAPVVFVFSVGDAEFFSSFFILEAWATIIVTPKLPKYKKS